MLRHLLVAVLVLGVCCAHADQLDRPLDILLTNDDGFDAEGLSVLRAALVAEGHRVSVVAPAANRSGASVSITSQGKLTWREVEPGVIAVDGTPADCIRLALTVLRSAPPDLVVSGVNFGQNIGAATLSSGTVGAALTASTFGVPAIAVSQTVDPNDVRGTVRYFPDAAAVAVSLIDVLDASGHDRLLPPGMTLNVNHPARMAPDVAGVRLTRQGRSSLYSVVYTREGEAAVSMAFAPNLAHETVANADTTAIAAGYVSITPLDGFWTAETAFDDFRDLARRLDTITRARAPTALVPARPD